MLTICKRSVSTRLYSTINKVKPKFTKLFIAGRWEKSASGNKFETIDPHTEEVIASVDEAGVEDVDRAVLAARNAFDEGPWRSFSGQQRAECLFRLAALIEKHREELTLLEALDNGKTVTMANALDVECSIQTYRYFAGWADKITGDTIPAHGNYFAYTRREPVGVVGQIIPWNFPMLMQAWKLAPALAAGCTVVMKSAEQTPLTALFIAQLTKEAGLPEGVFNMLSGFGNVAGRHLVSHPAVDKIAFTGSTKVGLEIMANSSQHNLKRISLECGGKSPSIVCDDAFSASQDITSIYPSSNTSTNEIAINGTHDGCFFNAGQSCNATTRIYVHEKIYDEFVEKAIHKAKSIKLGGQFSPDTTQGPLISKKQMERVLEYIDSGVKEGAKLVTGGKRYGSKGFHVEPTIFADVKDDMKICQEEIFGPVMSILKFSSLDDVIQRANDSQYGLAAGIFTNDINKAIYISNGLRVGQVCINCANAEQASTPFGGFKNSGIGRELGHQGIEAYLEDKTVIMSRPKTSLP